MSYRSTGLLTARGVALLLCLVYLFAGPIRQEADIISSALGFGLLALFAITLLYVITAGIAVRRTLKVSLIPPNEVLYSKASYDLAVSCSPFRILPLTHLIVTPQFSAGDLVRSSVRFTGKGYRERRGLIHVTFPHRGHWHCNRTQCEFADILGLIRVVWAPAIDITIPVHPPLVRDTRYPVLSSAQRPGDLVVDTLNRQGDLYDIKRYHPSDGAKKIIWKAYAKRRELLSRHPEASMTPEGFVVIFVLARAQDDSLAAHALSYTRMLDELQLDIRLGCQGMGSRAPARTPEQALDLLINSVWDSSTGSDVTLDMSALLSSCGDSRTSPQIDRIVIFCAQERFSDPLAAEELHTLSLWLTERGITPAFCFSAKASPVRPAVSQYRGITRWLTLPSAELYQKDHYDQYSAFLAGCAQRNWEVYV